MIIDTPGMREVGNFAVDTGIYGTFDEFNSDLLKIKEFVQLNGWYVKTAVS